MILCTGNCHLRASCCRLLSLGGAGEGLGTPAPCPLVREIRNPFGELRQVRMRVCTRERERERTVQGWRGSEAEPGRGGPCSSFWTCGSKWRGRLGFSGGDVLSLGTLCSQRTAGAVAAEVPEPSHPPSSRTRKGPRRVRLVEGPGSPLQQVGSRRRRQPRPVPGTQPRPRPARAPRAIWSEAPRASAFTVVQQISTWRSVTSRR